MFVVSSMFRVGSDKVSSPKLLKPSQPATPAEINAAPAVRSRRFATMFPGVAASWEQFEAEKRIPEKAELIADIQSGDHILWLEHNTGQWCKCRARNCLVAEIPNLAHFEDRIQGPYRCNLQALKPSTAHWSMLPKPDRRFFHLTCVESIMGSDLSKHLKIPATVIFKPPSSAGPGMLSHQDVTFEPIMRDWVRNTGRTFWAEAYNNDDYQEDRRKYSEELVAWATSHRENCEADACDCQTSEPIQPRLEDVVAADPWERSLCDVALDTIGAGHLIQVARYPNLDRSMRPKLIQILEEWGAVPAALSEKTIMRILKRLKTNKQERKSRERESSQAQDFVDERAVPVRAGKQISAGGSGRSA